MQRFPLSLTAVGAGDNLCRASPLFQRDYTCGLSQGRIDIRLMAPIRMPCGDSRIHLHSRGLVLQKEILTLHFGKVDCGFVGEADESFY